MLTLGGFAVWKAEVRRWATERTALIRLLWSAGGRPGAGLASAHLVRAFVPAAEAVVSGWLVAASMRGLSGQSISSVIPPMIAFAGLVLLLKAADTAIAVLDLVTRRKIDQHVRDRVRLLTMRQRHLTIVEDPAFQDAVARACGIGPRYQIRSAGIAVCGQMAVSARTLTGLAAAAVLIQYFPLTTVVFVGIILGLRSYLTHHWLRLAERHGAFAGSERGTEYLAETASDAGAGKEVRLFNLGDWLTSRWCRSFLGTHEHIWRDRREFVRGQLGAGGLWYIGTGLIVLLIPGWAALSGEIGPQALITCLVAGWGVADIARGGHENIGIAYGVRAALTLQDLTTRYGMPSKEDPFQLRPLTRTPHIRFENVSFAYPGSSHRVLDGLTLDIPPGQVLAIVGRNGAGKTTLIKLLAGLYRPDSGRILIDAVDLGQVDPAQWPLGMTAIFQDFVQYPFSLADNVTMSAPECVESPRQALARAGAGGIVDALPRGEETVLWRGGTDAADLSGGQWQKIAIARALHAVTCGRRLVVLDEPTAHLDVYAEAAFHKQVVRAVMGASVVLISHRLSTVRHADHIIYLDGGRITESGTHDQLLALDGEYARLFRLQASRFER